MDLGFIAGAYRGEGPYVTAYLQSRRVAEDAALQVGLRWQALAQQLRQAGADGAAVAAVQETILPRRPGAVTAQGRAVVAGADGVLLDRPLRTAPPPGVPELAADDARWAPLPHLLPLLGYEQQPVPHLLVVANRVGADIHVIVDGKEDVTVVDGADSPLHKPRGQGWSHRRIQQRAENQWEHNAGLVANAVSRLATRHRASLVLLAGDVRARAAIAEAAPTGVRKMIVETEHGSRAAGAADAPLREEAARLAAEHTQQAHTRLMDRFVTERGHAERAAEGVEKVIEAVRAGGVDTLLLDPAAHLDPGIGRPEVWVGHGGTDLAVTKTELERLGVEEYAADRADAALIRACVATGARLELLRNGDPTVTDGVAAVLRYPLPD